MSSIIPAADASAASVASAAIAAASADAVVSAVMPSLPLLRVLLLDNFDSYTLNIAHLCASLTHTPPIVRLNTMTHAELLALLRSERIDCVIVSPGPGTPERKQDFGVCTELYAHLDFAHVPILGSAHALAHIKRSVRDALNCVLMCAQLRIVRVPCSVCLGLQGQYCRAGGHIVPAAEPMHGRLSPIAHDGRGIFAGLPQRFLVVRYNSLVADANALPPGVEVSAWADVESAADGAPAKREIMGLRDVAPTSVPNPDAASDSRSPPKLFCPRESVQFHPESICTQYGRQLMHNWFTMVAEYQRARAAATGNHASQAMAEETAATSAAETSSPPSSAARPSQSTYALLHQRLPFFVDSEAAFMNLFGATSSSASSSLSSAAVTPSCFWLDSSKVERGRARFSFMGDNAGPLSYNIFYSVRQPLTLHTTRRGDAAGAMQHDTRMLESSAAIWKELEQLAAERHCSVHSVTDAGGVDLHTPSSASLPFNFESGLVGYIGYAMRHACVPDTLRPIHMQFDSNSASSAAVDDAASSAPAADDAAPFRVPDLAFMFADRLLVFDHQEQQMHLLCLVQRDAQLPGSVHEGLLWMLSTGVRLRDLASAASRSPPSFPPVGSSVPLPDDVLVQSRWFHSEPEYLRAIARSLRAIREGESYEICLTNQLDVTVTAPPGQRSFSPIEYYCVLRAVNPAAYAAFFRFAYEHFSVNDGGTGQQSACPADASSDAWSICCSSPERFLQVDRCGVVESKPIKGTLARGSTPAEDAALIARLRASPKDFAENLMIVDLLRHDLGRVCAWGSVRVPKLMEVETYATVHNLVSTITGTLAAGRSTGDLLQAAFPPGSMTGAPKMRTCQILAVLEEEGEHNVQSQQAHIDSTRVRRSRERGIYSGCIGWLGSNGSADLNVVIRTAIVTERVRTSQGSSASVHSTHLRIGAGGAIVHLSDPAAEFDEVQLKTRALMHAIRVAAQKFQQHV